ncbi:uncharacterized protein LOC114525545 [Dendronephthya gigantea]|uniref:uncharacterized protein LOC114525545 n=1 Tax=Dendronephthya gigantea TaxID=151771 RepID=UPI00106B4595|nr:uncharacterized protein LOC114525545 [Dendronephthya gigantea]
MVTWLRFFHVWVGVFVLIQIFLCGWFFFHKGHIMHHEVVKIYQNAYDIPVNVMQTTNSRPTESKTGYRYKGKIKGLDYQDLFRKVNGIIRKNLQVQIVRNWKSKTSLVTLKYTNFSFSKAINVLPKAKYKSPPKKYVFVHEILNDQLSKNTRALLSLCVQAGQSGRSVVRPFVRQTKFGPNAAWSHLETYFNETYLDNLLRTTGYTSLADKQEYLKECPSNNADHVSIHFIENSTASKKFTNKRFGIKDNDFNSILQKSTKKGWTECTLIDKTMRKTAGKQFCVNSAVITDWRVLERDIVKDAKCLNIVQWRGIDGKAYRLKFREDHLKFSSLDLTFALKPGLSVMQEVQRFRKENLLGNYIALYVRGEKILLAKSLDRLYECVDLLLEVLVALKKTHGLSKVLVATDMGDFGSGSLVRYRMTKHLNENVFKDIHDRILKESKGVTYSPSSDKLDRGVIALVDITLLSQARHLVSAGDGTFHEWLAARFLNEHRNDREIWSKTTVCANL